MSGAPDEAKAPAPARGPLFWLGAAALFLAMGTDTLAVAGRHLGVPVRGSIELVQACILVIASAAMLSATLSRGHAAVHLLTARLSPPAARRLARLANLGAGVFFAALAVGSAWLLADLWGGQEESDILRIPFVPLRALATLAAASVAAVFLFRAVRPGEGA